ncbi:mRNA splicing protein prp18 [Quaeritorhiza haematococci]|nr:mRNA splicing protein prp18 [Quaeritorhiza haematococci]
MKFTSFRTQLWLELKTAATAMCYTVKRSIGMDILKAELERKRKLLQTVTTAAASNNERPKKYMKRGELERLQDEIAQNSDDKKKGKISSSQSGPTAGASLSSSPSKGNAKDSTKNADEEDEDDHLNISAEEVIRRLRARDEPIRLFGETDKQRIKRLRALESMEERTEGQRNDFRKALEVTDKQAALEYLKRQAGVMDDGADESGASKAKKAKDVDREDIDTSIISLELLQSDPDKTQHLISVYFKRMMREWEKWLNERPEEVKQTTQAKLQAATQRQSAEYMKPFFKQLKKRQVAADVLARITEIVQFMHQREYLQANDSYLRLSIGNAPWPIGVTMVGIHERSAREKIFSSQVAHVLNDETQRKWIQSIKRLMTFAQTKWPPDDLAKLVG